MAEPDLDALRELAVDTARAAGDALAAFAGRHAAGDDLGFSTKTTVTDPVSEADRASERLIAERLAATRPDDGLLGEEGQAQRRGTSGLRWVVDPLDGTVNFLYGIPTWCVSIACEDDAGSLVGVVHDPSRDETFVAVRGGGATCNGHDLAVPPTSPRSTEPWWPPVSPTPPRRDATGRPRWPTCSATSVTCVGWRGRTRPGVDRRRSLRRLPRVRARGLGLGGRDAPGHRGRRRRLRPPPYPRRRGPTGRPGRWPGRARRPGRLARDPLTTSRNPPL